MKILFEGHKYSTQAVRNLLPNDYFDSNSTQPKLKVVGYYYSDEYNCPIIILPKVFLDETDNFFLDEINPEIFLQDNYLTSILNPDMRIQVANFLFECSSWFYFSIKKYFYKYRYTLSLFEDNLNIIDCSHRENFHTELDIIFSLLKFNKENKELFLFIKKISKSQNNKIDWNRTIRKTNPVIDSKGSPVYLETHSKKKQINADEDLLVLFFSLLKEIERKYNIKIPINPFYNLHSQKEYNKIKHRGTYYLRSIRYKYFDDRLLTLYRIIYTYFEKSDKSNIKDKRKEYLIIKDYNLVFQDMVDELLSDTDIPKKLKTHKDGKELDHIYKSKSFFEHDGIYFIGDSKYYKSGNPIEEKSIYKQFTYAKNVIQYNIDLFNKEGSYPNGIRYRDELSEGYNITPNFFVRGLVKYLNNTQPELTLDENQQIDRQINKHFPDRLFDRDTLIVQSYSINFLFVLWSYNSSNARKDNSFKEIAKIKFRESLVEFINSKYQFFLLTSTLSVQEFIKRHFYVLNGRIYRPANFEHTNTFILALTKGETVDQFIYQNEINDKINAHNYSID
jgi:hypothetical protein